MDKSGSDNSVAYSFEETRNVQLHKSTGNWLAGILTKVIPSQEILQTDVGRVAQSVWRLSYGLDGPGSNPGGDEIFRPSTPALGPTQPPVKRVPGSFPGVKCGRGMLLTTHPPPSAAVMEE